MRDHFYTTDPNERDAAATARYESEGVACFVYPNQVPNTLPLYRAFKPATYDHYYTTSLPDIHYAHLHQGYLPEGIACYVPDESHPNIISLLTLYNPTTGDNFYTTQFAEAQYASANFGYNYAGTACRVFGTQEPGTVPFFRLFETYDSYFGANLIGVGGDTWNAAQWQLFMGQLAAAALIYRNYGIRLQMAGTFAVPTARAGGYLFIDDNDEADDLTDDWNGPPGSADLFGVLGYAGDTAGLSAVNGSCDHSAKGMSGSVVELVDPLNVIIAHELGHYLGLDHVKLDQNVMRCVSEATNVLFTPEQVVTLKAHCYVHRY